MTKKETALVAAINAAWSQYEKDAASVYAVQATAALDRDNAIAVAIAEYDAVITKSTKAESTTEAAPLEEKIK
jgi:hypothetical protein